MNGLIYKTKGNQVSYWLDGKGDKVSGQTLEADTLLYLRNRECHLLDDKPNIFELANATDVIYVLLDSWQVIYVSGNIGTR